MKTSLLKSTLLFIAVLFSSFLFAQDWVNKMQDPKVNFYEVQKSFYKYYNKVEQKVEREKRRMAKKAGEPEAEGELEVPGFEQFKRWENFMAPRVSPTGERFAPNAVWNAMTEYKKGYNNFAAGNWTLLGPISSTVPSGGGGAGRLQFVTVHPTTPTTMWVGSPGGGLWKTTDGGSTWSTNTDQLPQVIGCNDLVIDKNNPNIMYLATGDADGGDTYSVGLLKTTDGGATWNTTGLSMNLPAFKQIGKVLIDPTNSNTIYVASTGGVYKSIDAAATFSVSLAGSFKDIEFQPGTPTTLYVCGNEFSRTTNSGATWTKITAVLPAAAACQRMAIAVSAATPTTVYLVAAKVTTYDLEGVYKSTNSGAAFTKLTVSSAIIGTQGFYAISIDASPTTANEIVVGGLDVWKCANVPNSGTATFTKMSDWVNSPYVHADIHELEYNGSNIYSACDGGLFVSSDGGSSWTDKSNGLQISEMYGFGQSATNASLLLQGWQDNGTNRLSGTSWSRVIGGDGMKAFISSGNDQNQWGSLYYGQLQRSTNGGTSFSACTSGITEFVGSAGPGPWVTEFNEDLTTANTLYCGFANVWKSTDGGGSWNKLGTISTSTVYVQAIAPAPTTNGQVILAAKGATVYRTTNGGTAWTAITALPNATVSDITFHPTNPQKAWVTFSGFSNINKVFQTTDQGVTWTNISASLPNIPVNCITVDKNGNNALYIGTDAGVFFKDASSIVWQPFSKGLPNVNITQLEIFYSGSKLRASTYGRGMWETTLFAGPYPPDANFAGNVLIGCPGLGVQFSDYSAGYPTSWNWTFQGGNPATSTAQNPFVAYNTTGTYSVSLTVTNSVGPANTETFNSYVNISSSQTAPTASSYTICGPQSVTLTATPSVVTPNAPIRWWSQPGGGKILATGNTYATTLWGTQTLYVDQSFPAGNLDLVGPTDNTIGTGAVFNANDIRGLYFDVLKPVIINSVKVYSTVTGMRTIEILDVNGNLVTDTTLSIAASGTVTPTTVTINRTVYPGTNYFMKFRGAVDAYRNNAGAAFPFIDGGSGCVKITETNAGSPGYYYFFYDWQITPLVCNTGRTAVQITDPCSLVGVSDLFLTNQLNVFPNPSNGEFTLSFHLENLDNYTVKVTNTIGQAVYEEKLNNFNGTYSNKIDISSFRKGVYMLSVSNSRNEAVKKVLVY